MDVGRKIEAEGRDKVQERSKDEKETQKSSIKELRTFFKLSLIWGRFKDHSFKRSSLVKRLNKNCYDA